MQFEYSCMSYLCMFASWTAPHMGWCVCVCVCARTSAPMCTLPASVCVCEQVPTYCTLPAVHFHAPQSQSSGYPRFCCCCSYSHLPKAKHRMIEAEQEGEWERGIHVYAIPCNIIWRVPFVLLSGILLHTPHTVLLQGVRTHHTRPTSRGRDKHWLG